MGQFMSQQLRQGKAVLNAKPVPLSKRANCYVRYYYPSEGGELLCCEAGPLTWQAAASLPDHCGALPPGCAIERYELKGYYSAPRLREGARLVKFPSQCEPPVLVSEEEQEMREAA